MSMQLSPQSQKVYEILLEERSGLTVTQIAFKLRVAAGDVYRLAKPLIDIGLIEKGGGRPLKLSITPGVSDLDLFLSTQSRWFINRFRSQNKNYSEPIGEHPEMQLEFIQGRDELMRISVDEVIKASGSIDLLRSGHEIPPDLMLAMVQAVRRGVKIRMLVQGYGDENKDQVGNWIRNGIIIRKTGIKHLRLMIYDSDIGYFMSYKHSDSGQDVGMKIVYPAFTAILSQYFEDLWQKSEKI